MKFEEDDEEVVLDPDSPARAAVIWLHGLGADGYDFVPLVPELRLPDDAAIRFIFPHAPVRPVSINGGQPMRAWYDILGLDFEDRQDAAGIRASAARIGDLIAGQRDAGIASDKIVIAGFSQGGAVALQLALRYPQRLAGLLALSTYLPLQESLAAERSAANRDLPILMCHGSGDSVVPAGFGAMSRDALRSFGYAVDWREYPMDHTLCDEEIDTIGAWLRYLLLA